MAAVCVERGTVVNKVLRSPQATKVFQVLKSSGGSYNKVSGLHFIDCDFHATSPDPWVLDGVDAASCTSVNSSPPFPVK